MMAYLFSALLMGGACLWILFNVPTAAGWHVAPLFAAGVLAGKDAIVWLRGHMNLFDPLAFLGLFGLVFYFISPVLQTGWDYWVYLPPLTHAREWILLWGLISLAGLVLFRLMVDTNSPNRWQPATHWQIEPDRFWLALGACSVLAVAAQAYVYLKLGGISGMIEAYSLRTALDARFYDPFEGLGVPVLLGDSFRNLFALGLIYYCRNKPYAQKLWFFVVLMLVCLAVFMLFGGLRGSRGSVVYSLFWAVGMYHFWVRPLSRKLVLAGVAGLMLFMSTYYWYKFAGKQGLDALFNPELRATLQGERGDETKFVIARDLGRMDFQALTLKEVFGERDFPLSWGRSYPASVFSVVPSAIMPDSAQPPTITKEKTELIYGDGTYVHGAPRETTLLMGQLGEMVVNFGLLGPVLYFVVLGAGVVAIRRRVYGYAPNDARLLLMPLIVILPIQWMMYDSSVMVMFLVRNLMLPGFVVWFASRKMVVAR